MCPSGCTRCARGARRCTSPRGRWIGAGAPPRHRRPPPPRHSGVPSGRSDAGRRPRGSEAGVGRALPRVRQRRPFVRRGGYAPAPADGTAQGRRSCPGADRDGCSLRNARDDRCGETARTDALVVVALAHEQGWADANVLADRFGCSPRAVRRLGQRWDPTLVDAVDARDPILVRSGSDPAGGCTRSPVLTAWRPTTGSEPVVGAPRRRQHGTRPDRRRSRHRPANVQSIGHCAGHAARTPSRSTFVCRMGRVAARRGRQRVHASAAAPVVGEQPEEDRIGPPAVDPPSLRHVALAPKA